MRFLTTLFSLLIVSLSVRAQLGFTLTNNRHRVEIPIEICSNLIIIPLVLNNALPLKFILDTGVRTTILTDKSLGEILNLNYIRQYSIAGVGNEKNVEAFVANNVIIDLAGVHGTGHAILVLAEDYLQLRNYLGMDVHGILGYELFSRFVIEINYEQKKLTLTLPKYYKPRKSFTAFDIEVKDTKPYICVPIELRAGSIIEAKLLLDTGASHGLLLEPNSDGPIFVPEKNMSSIIGRGLGGTISGKIGRINSIILGKYKFEDVITSFPNPDSYSDSSVVNRNLRQGTLGGEILSRFTTVYNMPEQKLYIKKNSTIRRKFNYDMSGLTIKASGTNLRRYNVSDIREDSGAAKVGIQIGDELISINGLLAKELDLTTINGYFNTKPKKQVRIVVLRNNQILKKTIILENPI